MQRPLSAPERSLGVAGWPLESSLVAATLPTERLGLVRVRNDVEGQEDVMSVSGRMVSCACAGGRVGATVLTVLTWDVCARVQA